MKALIKIGGTLLDRPETRLRLAAEIGAAIRGGLQTVVVHGGGKQMTDYLAERGIESRFIGGLRVTGEKELDAVLKVLAGTVNQELVAAFISAGVSAVGLTGMDALLVEAEPISPELGFAGRPVRSNPALLNLLVEHGYLPVVACVGGNRAGRFYNVNADQMAVACAAAFGARQLLFLTDVEGVRGPGGLLCPALTAADCRRLIAAGTATGGMRAKLDAAADALARGLAEIVIAPGGEPGVIAKILAGQRAGTRLVPESPVTVTNEAVRNG